MTSLQKDQEIENIPTHEKRLHLLVISTTRRYPTVSRMSRSITPSRV